jgi:lactate dehydrogenase-like 2-hydroxyacid dehydrogenase
LPDSSQRIHLLQLGPWLGRELQQAIQSPFVVHSLFDAADPAAMLGRIAHEVRAVLCHSGGLVTDQLLLDRLPKLELILNLGAGTESVDVKAAEARGIRVMNSAGFNAADVAELALGMMLALGRNMMASDRHVREGKWPHGNLPVSQRVSQKRLGLLGMGAIGKAIARRAAAFDMDVSYFSRRRVADVPWNFQPDLCELAANVDYLVSTLPGGGDTYHLVDRRVLDALGPSGFLVSVGRGSVIDEHELVEALETGRIAGAALDVFEHEPHVPAPLMASTKTLLQSHRGGATAQAHIAIVQETLRRLDAHFLSASAVFEQLRKKDNNGDLATGS